MAILRVPETARPVKRRPSPDIIEASSVTDQRDHAQVEDVLNPDSDIDMPHLEQHEGDFF